ncbi:MAG: hypothetical protein AMXMBFR84_05620 [Candidatus Hydrogenedentota bacterium]
MGSWLLLMAALSADRIDMEEAWRFRHDPHHVGVQQEWFVPGHDDTWWAGMNAGLRWEEQGFPDGDGHGWYRKWVEIPADWKGKPAWFVVGGINDACTIYCNGKLINTYGDERDGNALHQTAVIADVAHALQPGTLNLITVDVHDWGGSGGLWRTPCFLTLNAVDLPMDTIFTSIRTGEHGVKLFLDAMGLGLERGPLTFEATYDEEGRAMRSTTELPAGKTMGVLNLTLPDGQTQPFSVNVAVKDEKGEIYGGIRSTMEIPPRHFAAWQGEYGSLRVLNNFVTELVATDVSASSEQRFLNPRDGWVFVRVSGVDEAVAHWNGAVVVWRKNPDTGALEAMRKLSAGEHTLHIDVTQTAKLDIRAVPELAYCAYPADPAIKPFGPYDLSFVSRHVLPHVNTLITHGDSAGAFFDEWLDEGRIWLDSTSVPGLYAPEPPAPAEAAAKWASSHGASHAGFAGIIVDEFFWSGKHYYDAWTDALKRLYANPAFADRTFYAWTLELHRHGPAVPFVNQLLESGGCVAWEKYLIERVLEDEAWADMARLMIVPYREWKSAMPELAGRLMMTLGYMCAPPGSFNHQPGADYQTFKDMQYFVLATDPTFRDLRGVLEFTASYADEESLRWSHQLIRHYCIEGNTERFTGLPYELPHLQNPDFAEGLNGWKVFAASPESVATETIPGYSYAQGRYPRSGFGDPVCVMTRSAEKANMLQQEVRELEPERWYSLKVIVSNQHALGEKRPAELSIGLDRVALNEKACFSYTYGSTNAVEELPAPSYFTLHRFVFKPDARVVLLTLSDWSSAGEPLGEAGDKTAVNFIELQPYHPAGESLSQ